MYGLLGYVSGSDGLDSDNCRGVGVDARTHMHTHAGAWSTGICCVFLFQIFSTENLKEGLANFGRLIWCVLLKRRHSGKWKTWDWAHGLFFGAEGNQIVFYGIAERS